MSKSNTLIFRTSLYSLLIAGVILIQSSCAETQNRDKKEENKEEESKPKNTNLLKLSGKVFSIPSPIQTAFLIKESGASFQADVLNATDLVTNYATTNKKALNLGVYGADLGYSTIYDQTQEAISYMAVTKRLSNELGISNLFDEKMLKRFESNLGNQDSLLGLVSDAFKFADRYLKENKQNDLSVMILAGGWVETLYFACKLNETNGSDVIKKRIGEQKITIKNLINLLKPFQEDESMSELIVELEALKEIYDGIGYSYQFNEPITDSENKVTKITSVSEVDINDEQLASISKHITDLRNSIIN